jgi:hypothetical protein
VTILTEETNMHWFPNFLAGRRVKKKQGNQARRARPALEGLEDRQLLSASAFSNLLNVPVQFTLREGHLLMTRGGVQSDVAANVQGLYQGKDVAGHQVAYERAHNVLSEFTPDRGWVSLGAADQVAQLGTDAVLFTRGGELLLATGAPGADLPLLANVHGLSASGDQASVQIGPYFKANLTVQVASSGETTLGLTNVQMNVGQFAAGFLSTAITNLQAFTRPLAPLADALDKPLVPGWGLTTTWLLEQLGYGQAAADAKAFAGAIHAINNLPASLSATDAWVNLGSLTARAQGPTGLMSLGSTVNAGAGIASQLGASAEAALAELKTIPGLQVALDDPKELIKLITGENTTLFSYTLSVPHAISVAREQQLAAIPVSPVTLTEIDLYAKLGVSLSASATFGFDTSGFRSGDLAKGFFIQNAGVTASLTAGLSGLVNEANLAGYELTGAVTGTVTASLRGANGSGKLSANQLGTVSIVVSPPNWRFGVTTRALGPQQMLSLAVQQYGPYLKKLVGADAEIAANILHGKGVGVNDIAVALGTVYGIPPDKTAGMLKKLSAGATEIAGALKKAYSTAATDVAAILQGLQVSPDQIAGALQSAYQQSAAQAKQVVQWLVNQANKLDQAANRLGQQALDTATRWYNSTVAQLESAADHSIASWNKFASGARATYDATVRSWNNWLSSNIAAQTKRLGSWQTSRDQTVSSWNNWLSSNLTVQNNWLSSWQNYRNQTVNYWVSWRDSNIASWAAYMDSMRSWAASNLAKVGLTLHDIGLGLAGVRLKSFSSYVNDVKGGAQKVGDAIQGAVHYVGSQASQAVNEAANYAKQFASSIKDQLMAALNNAQQQIRAFEDHAAGKIQEVENGLRSARNTYNQTVASLRQKANDAIHSAETGLRNAQRTYDQAVASLRQKAHDGLKSAAAALAAARAQAAREIAALQQHLQSSLAQAGSQFAGMKGALPHLVSAARARGSEQLSEWAGQGPAHRPANLEQAAEAVMASFFEQSLKSRFPKVNW